jgi:hypothetical protein
MAVVAMCAPLMVVVPAGAAEKEGCATTDDPGVTAGVTALTDALKAELEAASTQPFLSGRSQIAEYRDYLERLALRDLETSLLNADGRPFLLRGLDPLSNDPDGPDGIGLANPDNLYYSSLIRDDATYRITGRRGTEPDLSFQVLAGEVGINGVGTNVSTLGLDELHVSPDGTFAVTVSPTRPATGDWLALAPGARTLVIRQVFNNWSREKPDSIRLESVGATGTTPACLSSAALAAAATDAAEHFKVEAPFWPSYFAQYALKPNTLTPPLVTKQGLPTQRSSFGPFDLAPGQALVITVGASDARYMGLQIGPLWAGTLRNRNPVSLNGTQARRDSDGSYRYVISATDPHVPNWIDTRGHQRGFVFMRWQGLSPAPSIPAPTAEVVDATSLASALPSGTPRVTTAQRKAEIATRLRALKRRLRLGDNDIAPRLRALFRQLAAQSGEPIPVGPRG